MLETPIAKATSSYAEIKRYFKFYNKQDVLSITRIRRFETKVGERLQVISNTTNLDEALSNSTARYVIVGIPEDLI